MAKSEKSASPSARLNIRFTIAVLTLFVIANPLARAQDVARFRLDADLVYLSVTVTDRNGRAVDGLQVDDFEIYEDRVGQEIAHFDEGTAPLTVGLVLDRSRSMWAMIDEVYEAALHVVEDMERGDEAFVVTFNEGVELVQESTDSPRKIRKSLRDLDADGQTALYDAVDVGLEYLDKSVNRRRVLCVVTDGRDTSSGLSFEDLAGSVAESNALIYVVGMGEKEGWFNWGPFGSKYVKKLKELAKLSGGTAHFPNSVEECRKTMREIAKELHSQYGLGYYPSNPLRNGKWRNLAVNLLVDKKKYVVRSREGYDASRMASAVAAASPEP